MEEAEDSSSVDPSTFKQSPVRKQKFLPQSIPSEQVSLKYPLWGSKRFSPSESNTPKKIPSKEAEDSSPVDHASTLLLSKYIPTTLQQVSHPQATHERWKIPPHAHLLLSEFSPFPVDLRIKTTRAHIL